MACDRLLLQQPANEAVNCLQRLTPYFLSRANYPNMLLFKTSTCYRQRPYLFCYYKIVLDFFLTAVTKATQENNGLLLLTVWDSISLRQRNRWWQNSEAVWPYCKHIGDTQRKINAHSLLSLLLRSRAPAHGVLPFTLGASVPHLSSCSLNAFLQTCPQAPLRGNSISSWQYKTSTRWNACWALC